VLWNPVQVVSNIFRRREAEPIARIAAGAEPQVLPRDTTSPDPLYRIAGAQRRFREVISLNDLVSVKRDCWEMYVNDGDVAAQIDGIGLDATCSDDEGLPFRIEPKIQADVQYEKDANGRRVPTQAQQEINALFEAMEDTLGRIGLYDCLAWGCSMAVLLGDHFDEVVWDKRPGKFWPLEIRPIPSIREGCVMRELRDPARDMMAVGWGLFDVDTGQLVREFFPWEVMRYAWNENIPILTSVRLQWNMLRENEQDLYSARKSRAFAKIHRVIEGATPNQLLEFQAAEDKRKAENPVGVDSDTIGNAQAQLLDPSNAQLANVGDLTYRRRILQSAGRKPIGELAAYGGDINRATLDKQDETYGRLLSRVNTMANLPIRQLVRTLILLQGKSPEEWMFRLRWTDRSYTPLKEKADSLAVAVHKFGLSPVTALREMGYDFEEEADLNQYADEVLGTGQDPFAERVQSELATLLAAQGNGSGNGNGNAAVPPDQTMQPGAGMMDGVRRILSRSGRS
jgi:hypothetical protein